MGRKRLKIDTNFQPKKKNKCAERSFVGNDDDDRISQLPDDILVNILSLLSMKEAGRTSVLASRWINLWKHTHSLDFDAGSELEEMVEQSQSDLINSRALKKYLKWVNSVILSHKSPTLKLFRIRFPLDRSDTKPVTRWLQFACCRQVQRLELDFRICNNWYKYYRPPEELVALRISTVFEFKSLKSLCFRNATLSDGAIEFFLRNCPLLEQLIVEWPSKISKLKVCGSSLLLKRLEILYCPGLGSLKISAPNLTSLRVTSLEGLLLENVPMLVDLSIGFENNSVSAKHLLSVMCCCVSQLESLNLVLRRSYDRRATDELCLPPNLPEMPKLKKLVVEYALSGGDESLFRLASLTKAAPYLQEFVFKNKLIEWGMTLQRVDDGDDAAGAIIRFRHENLKVFKFCGYYGRHCDDALVRYILENCVVLEKIIIDPSAISCRDRLRVEKAARKNAKQHLQPLFPHHVKFVLV